MKFDVGDMKYKIPFFINCGSFSHVVLNVYLVLDFFLTTKTSAK